MKPFAYYELRGAVVEMFYETLLAEKYTMGQAASRCLVEFRREILDGRRDALVVLAAIFSRVARHEAAALARFRPELERLGLLARNPSCWKGLEPSAKERLREDVRFILEKSPGRASRRRGAAPSAAAT